MDSRGTILVTGGAGFLGRHLVASHLKDGHEVWIVDNLFTGKHPDTWLTDFQKKIDGIRTIYEKGSQRVVFIEADLIDLLREELREPGSAGFPDFDEVYHLAAIVGGRAVLIEQRSYARCHQSPH